MAKARVMVVEDERIVAEDIKVSLERLGYEVVALVASGEEAVTAADQLRPDLILMDIVLRGEMDGIEAAGTIRTSLGIPVLYLTAYADPSTVERAKETAPFGYLIKPFNDRELETTIEIALHNHQLEKKVLESQERLRTTLLSIGDGVVVTDLEGRVDLLNKVAEELTGYSQSEARGRPVDEIFRIINEKTGEPAESPVARVLREGKVVGLANHTVLISKDGAHRVIDDSGAPIKGAQGELSGVVLVFRDVTQRRNVEETIRRLQRLESLGVLAGGIAHDFNNLLTVIMGYLSMAREILAPDHVVAEYLREAEKSARTAEGLTRQFLTFSKGGAPVLKVCSLKGLLEEAGSLAGRGSNVKIEFAIPEDLWNVEVDRSQVGQVVNNLVLNACQAMPTGGTLSVSAENLPAIDHLGLPLPEGQYVQVAVADEGVGIARDHLDQVFDPYYTTKQEGSGLGLATAHSVIRKHNGYLGAVSTLGQGSTFFFFLPALPDAVVPEVVQPAAVEPGEGRILVMDDERPVLEVCRRMLQASGYQSETAADGEEAIVRFREAMDEGRPFDAVILDLTVKGGMGGRDAAEEILKIDPNARLIVSSGYSTDPVMARYSEFGFAGVVTKPYRLRDLSHSLSEVLQVRGR